RRLFSFPDVALPGLTVERGSPAALLTWSRARGPREFEDTCGLSSGLTNGCGPREADDEGRARSACVAPRKSGSARLVNAARVVPHLRGPRADVSCALRSNRARRMDAREPDDERTAPLGPRDALQKRICGLL